MIPTPSRIEPALAEPAASPAELAVLLRARLVFLLACAALGAVLAGWALQPFTEELYPSKAQLVVAPPKLLSTLAPDPMTVQGYQSLLESSAVLSETLARLRSEGVIGEDDRLELGDELDTRISISSRSEEPLSSVLEVQAVWGDPESSARIANTWIEVFIERSRERRSSSTLAALELVERQYPDARRRQQEVETEIRASTDELRSAYDAAVASWENRLQKTRLETRRRFAELERSVLGSFPAETADAAVPTATAELRDVLLELIALRGELAQVERPSEPYLPGETRAELTSSGQPRASAAPTGTDPNTTMQPTQRQSFPIMVEVELAGRIASREAELARRGASSGAAAADAASGLATRSAELQGERRLALAALSRQRNRELASLDAAASQRLLGLEQEVARLELLGAALADSQNQALLAREQLALDEIHVASAAIPADRPIAARRSTRAFLGALAGAFAGALASVVLEARRRDRDRIAAA